MATFLFWNLNRKPLQSIIAKLAAQYNIDVMIFAECVISPATMLGSLNEKEAVYHYIPSKKCKKIELYTRFPHELITIIDEDDRLTIRNLKIYDKTDIILAAIHFPSKMHWDNASQAQQCVHLAKKIREAEEQVEHSRTILVGDLNMNPFEDGVISAYGLHAVMSRVIAEKKSRVVQREKYPFFYNPMWNFLGDVSGGPPGTYYYSASTPKNFFWNMFDQLLIRPELLSLFSHENLKILTASGKTSFLTKEGRPNAKVASDHLPLLFTLDL